MKNSEQIKQAPDPTGKNHSQQIFRNFTDAMVALLDSPDTPKELSEALTDAITEAGNQIGIPDSIEVTRGTLSWILDLKGAGRAEEVEETTAASADRDEDEEADRAAEELAKAFATIEEYRDYLPARVYDGIDGWVMDFYDDSQWQCKPDVMRKVLPHILRAAIAKESEEDDD